jgi:mRNA-degrading endonuclease toxin of MazEF toxin-antitoxin module
MKSGDIFWAKSEGIADEEQGRHPWIVLSRDELARRGSLVVAVPVTSNPTRYKRWDVYMVPSEVVCANDVMHPLDPNKLEGVVKCAKLRHWSIERIDEVVGSATPFFLSKLRRVVADALEIPRASRTC